MNKPSGYDGTKAASFGFNGPSAGPQVLGIVSAVVGRTKDNSKEKITLSFDIAKGEFKNFYRDLSDKHGKDCFLKYDQLTEGEKSLPYFKGMITAIEESNAGFTFNFDEKTLTRKLVGAMLQEKHYINKLGAKKSILKVAFLCSIAKAESGTLKTPDPEFPEDDNSFNSNANNQSNQGLLPEEDLPF